MTAFFTNLDGWMYWPILPFLPPRLPPRELPNEGREPRLKLGRPEDVAPCGLLPKFRLPPNDGRDEEPRLPPRRNSPAGSSSGRGPALLKPLFLKPPFLNPPRENFGRDEALFDC